MPDSLLPEDEIARLRVEKDQGASFGPGYSAEPEPVPVSALSGEYPSRYDIAQALYAVTNRILAPKLWDGWSPRPLEEDPAAFEAHYAYADAVLEMMLPRWKPIETAPRDETWILVCGHHTHYAKPVVVRFYMGGWTTWGEYGDHIGEPTHWQPLDAPPDCAPQRQWYRRPDAPGIDARSDETRSGSAVGESLVREAEAAHTLHTHTNPKREDTPGGAA